MEKPDNNTNPLRGNSGGLSLKYIFILLGMFAITAYLAFSIVSFSGRDEEKICKEVKIDIKDSTERKFINETTINKILRNANINPAGQKLKDINPNQIEKTIAKHPVIEEVECYKTSSGKVKIDVWQKKPMFRVIANNGENYYVDYKRNRMPLSDDFVAYIPIVTGNANKEFITKELFDFIVFLHDHKFWDSQIAQISVNSNKEIELVPRVGNQIILLGTLDNYEIKLKNLFKLYEEAFNKGGWNQYSKINLQYEKQIICTKKQQ